MTFGFSVTLLAGAACYLLAAATAMLTLDPGRG